MPVRKRVPLFRHISFELPEDAASAAEYRGALLAHGAAVAAHRDRRAA